MWLAIAILVALWAVGMAFRWEIRTRWWAYRLVSATSPKDGAYYFACLTSVGDRSLGAARSLLANPSPEVRRQGVAILHWCRGGAARAALLEALRDADGDVRETAALGLALHHDQAALPELLKLARSNDANLAMAAAIGLERVGGTQAGDALLELLKRPSSPDLKAQAVDSLGLIGARQAVPALIDLLSDEQPLTTRPVADRKALQAIQAMGLDLSRKGIDPATIDMGVPETLADLAARSLHRIMGESFGFRSTDPPERKAAVIRLYRNWWATHQAPS